jgi:hypothetical protein
MITAEEAKQIVETTYQTKLDNYIKEHQKFFDIIEEKIKEASNKMKYFCFIRTPESIINQNQKTLEAILQDRYGYHLTFNFYTNELIINWDK